MSQAFLDNTGKLIIEDGSIIYRNFSGIGSEYNHEGDRNFCVFIDNPDLVAELQDLGWNVKIRKPRTEEDDIRHYIKINVSFNGRKPPVIKRHIGNVIIDVDETTISELDQDDIISCDMVINPYNYIRNGRNGISGYINELHVIVQPDYFASKYSVNEGLVSNEQ